MRYHCVPATRRGGQGALEIIEHKLRPPAAGEAHIRVLAAPVCRPDITICSGDALYTGTPPGQNAQ